MSDPYRLLEIPTKHEILVHGNGNLCELWQKRLGHLHYGFLPLLKDMVQGLLDSKFETIGMCKGCALNRHVQGMCTQQACQDGILNQ